MNTLDQTTLEMLLEALAKRDEEQRGLVLAAPSLRPALSSTPMTPAPASSLSATSTPAASGGSSDSGGGGIGLPIPIGLPGMGGDNEGMGLPGLGNIGLPGMGGGMPGGIGEPERDENGEIDWKSTAQKGTTTLANFLGPLSVNSDGGSFDSSDWIKGIANALFFYFTGGASSLTSPSNWYDYAKLGMQAYEADQVYGGGGRTNYSGLMNLFKFGGE